MINIAFLVSANKTIIFEEVSKRLKMDGYNTYWISPSQNWTKWLISNNILAECILNLPEKVINISSAVLSKDELKEISHIEVTNKKGVLRRQGTTRNTNRVNSSTYPEIPKILEIGLSGVL